MKVMKFDGSIVERECMTFDWVSGEQEYELVYVANQLYGVVVDDLNEAIQQDIIDRPYAYDFPVTLEDYLN